MVIGHTNVHREVFLADKEGMERKVYVLPAELGGRIRAYQLAQGISSEVEAARRLLDSALQMRDTTEDILKKLKSRFAEEKDLRVLARDILAGHPLVSAVHFADDGVWFYLKGEERGKIGRDGKTFSGQGDVDEGWHLYPPPAPRARAAAPSWDTPKGGDLDDEIPF